MIHRHPHVITAMEIRIKDSTGVFDPVVRFTSMDELVGHFTNLGASLEALDAIQNSVKSTGVATIVFSERRQRTEVH